MKAKIIKPIVFILILIMILMLISKIVVPKKNQAEFGMNNFKANGYLGEKENTIDVLVVGDSESFSSIVPMELWRNYGITSYVCGTPAQEMTDSILFTYRVMQTQNPKIVILEANNIYRDVPIEAPIEKILNLLLPVTEYHNRWKKLTMEDFFEGEEYSWKHSLKGYDYSLATNKADDSEYMEYTSLSKEIPFANQIYVKILNEYCKANNAELIIVSTPSTVNWDYKEHNSLKKLSEETGIEFLDLNELKDEIDIDWDTDTRDNGDHLNHRGAVKVTGYLGKYLSEKNILEDHRQDENYKAWNIDLEDYLSFAK